MDNTEVAMSANAVKSRVLKRLLRDLLPFTPALLPPISRASLASLSTATSSTGRNRPSGMPISQIDAKERRERDGGLVR